MMLFMLEIVPCPSKRQEVPDILRHMVGPTFIQPCCQAYEIYEGRDDNQTVLYQEQSTLFARLLSAMELSTTQPMIRSYEISPIHGIELSSKSSRYLSRLIHRFSCSYAIHTKFRSPPVVRWVSRYRCVRPRFRFLVVDGRLHGFNGCSNRHSSWN